MKSTSRLIVRVDTSNSLESDVQFGSSPFWIN